MKTDKKEFIRLLKLDVKDYMARYIGVFSDMPYPENIKLPEEISEGEAREVFGNMLTSFINRERGKALTIIKNERKAVGAISLALKCEFLQKNPDCKTKLKGFNYQESLSIYKEALTLTI